MSWTEAPIRTSILLGLCLVGAQMPATPAWSAQPSPHSDVLAESAQGPITEADLAAEIQWMSADEKRFRTYSGHSLQRQQRDLLHRIALRRQVKEEAPNPELVRASERQTFLRSWRQRCYGLASSTPSLASLAESFEPILIPDRIRASHIFLRAESAEELAAASQKLSQLKTQVATLDDFRRLASEHSESLTASKGGQLGALRAEWLTEGTETLFELPAGTMSEPMPLRGGVHLFWVEKVMPAQTISAQDQAKKPYREAQVAALDRCQSERLKELRGVPTVAPGWRQLRYGKWSSSRADFLRAHPEIAFPDASAGLAQVQQIVQDEALLQAANSLGEISADDRQRMRILSENALLDSFVSERARERIVPATQEQIQTHLAQKTYRSTRRMAVRFIETEIPEGRDPMVFLDQLTRFADALRSGDATWSESQPLLAEDRKVQTTELRNALDIANLISPAVMSEVATLPVGGVSKVRHQQGLFYVVELLADEQSVPLTGEEAADKARRYIESKQIRGLKAAVSGELLTASGFRLTPAGERLLSSDTSSN